MVVYRVKEYRVHFYLVSLLDWLQNQINLVFQTRGLLLSAQKDLISKTINQTQVYIRGCYK
jgi:hypothetical protein